MGPGGQGGVFGGYGNSIGPKPLPWQQKCQCRRFLCSHGNSLCLFNSFYFMSSAWVFSIYFYISIFYISIFSIFLFSISMFLCFIVYCILSTLLYSIDL
ncbi:hypothetical protein BDF14DRAFT_1797056 [Spinellus fusiger]|nr:hypothetical protein BDF14DRAFT_1797056 [Spinellus fusiger]